MIITVALVGHIFYITKGSTIMPPFIIIHILDCQCKDILPRFCYVSSLQSYQMSILEDTSPLVNQNYLKYFFFFLWDCNRLKTDIEHPPQPDLFNAQLELALRFFRHCILLLGSQVIYWGTYFKLYLEMIWFCFSSFNDMYNFIFVLFQPWSLILSRFFL